MNSFKSITGLIIATFLYTLPLHAQRSTQAIQEVTQAIEAFNQAFLTADVIFLDQHLTEEYIHSNSGSALIDKKGWLNYIKKRHTQLKSGQLKVHTYQMTELTVKVYGNSAIANGLITSSGVFRAKKFKSIIRVTQMWVKEKNVWKRAAFHDSKLSK
ncbi:nuclear transport factor 2 family protein [Microscilla marina]|uniref:DUF4440 domain-containing protein n=1 Tax=Microscilla marina ATCC 23134 TaxID=313606 RepID=A1ZKC4_MICM2|nr:nuclear transport factor 2 family protein [Microscilla marina]EAY29150.1 hypothetical protein M23134_02341 [Microscilla marina ATCC 23134]